MTSLRTRYRIGSVRTSDTSLSASVALAVGSSPTFFEQFDQMGLEAQRRKPPYFLRRIVVSRRQERFHRSALHSRGRKGRDDLVFANFPVLYVEREERMRR